MTNCIAPDRRKFMAAGSLAAVASALPISAQEAKSASRIRANQDVIYKSTKTGGNLNHKSLLKLKELGFDGVESVSPGVKDIPALRQLCTEVEMPIHGVVDMVHWKDRLSSPDLEIRDRGRRALEQAIRDSHALGGSSVLLVPGRVGGDRETHDHVWERSITEIQKVLPIASWYGIHVLIETVWNGFCTDPRQLAKYIDEIDSPWVQVYFDIGNMQKFAPAHEWIRTLGSRIVKLDVKDWGVKPGFCRLGDGDVDWAEVRKALKEIGFTGWATREGSDGGNDKTAALMNELLDL